MAAPPAEISKFTAEPAVNVMCAGLVNLGVAGVCAADEPTPPQAETAATVVSAISAGTYFPRYMLTP
jgi:hypothetical protein